MIPFLFYLFGGLALVSATAVILLPKPTRALLSLIVAMFALAVVYLLPFRTRWNKASEFLTPRAQVRVMERRAQRHDDE